MHSPLPTKPVFTQSKVEPKRQASRQPRFTFWAGLALMVIILAVAVLANRELARIQMLQARQVETAENLDRRAADQRAAQAAVDDANAQIRDARFDLDHCRIVAPFTGRIGSHLVSVGNLISGSRAGTSPTTLLATLVSIDPIYLNFDMSEADT
jgi:membrane fusion protein, multidrug efflux system